MPQRWTKPSCDELGDSEFRCDFCSSCYFFTKKLTKSIGFCMRSMLVSWNANPVAWSILTFSWQVSDSEVSLGAACGTTEHGSVELLLCRIDQTPRNGMECRENWKNAKRVGQSICISRNRVKSLLNFNQWLSIKPTKVKKNKWRGAFCGCLGILQGLSRLDSAFWDRTFQ